ncbi:MAG: hypothetical protein RRY04_07805 [Oscillospiraceae bacterium]
MKFLIYISPLLLGVLGNVFYNVVGKSTPKKINPFFSLSATYCVALLVCVALFFISPGDKNIFAAAAKANWTSYCLGACIIFTDLSLILLFRVGWDISIGSLLANIVCSVIVVFIGVSFFGENFTLMKFCGIITCTAGLYVINSPEKSARKQKKSRPSV